MKNVTRRDFIALAFGALAFAAMPTPAEAMADKFRADKKINQNGIIYLLHGRDAIVTKCAARKSVTIPHRIKHSGRTYTVAAIWDGAISRKTSRVVLKARDLDTIEDVGIWRRKDLTIICSDASTRSWLKRGSSARIK